MRHYQLLPAARVGIGAQAPLPMMRQGFGADLNIPTVNISSFSSTVDSALQAMVSDLASNGCQASDTPSVRAFQSAYNDFVTANGGTALTVDGLYGANTEAAANSVNTTDQLGLNVPAGCVAAASSSDSSSGGSSSPAGTSSQVVNVSTGSSPYVPYLVAGAVAVTAVGGYALWHHHQMTHGGAHRAVRHVARRVHPRRRR